MAYIYEKVNYDEHLPAKMLMQDKPGRRCNTSLHWHKEIELVYMIKGCLHIRTNGVESEIKDGEYYICNSQDVHITYVDDMEKNYTYFVILLSAEELEKYCDNFQQYTFQVKKENLAYDEIKEQIQILVSLCQSKAPYITLKKNACLMNIIYILLSKCLIKKEKQLNVKKIRDTTQAKEMIRYIDQNYKERITLEDAAKVVGFSAQYFSKYFHNLTETSFVHYLQQVRAEHALKDMLNEDLSVTDAAYENGFNNVKSFITTCKRLYGVTPTQYKKEVKK